MSRIWYTSDLHLGHDRVAELRGMTTDDHDDWIADQWTIHVLPDDHVWILGDLSMSTPAAALVLIDSLPGTKHLIAGNHDPIHPMHRNAHKHTAAFGRVFASVQMAAVHKIGAQRVLLSHFPYVGDHTDDDRHTQWRLPDHGWSLLHGHTHSTSRGDSHMVHVGVDAWGRPVSRDEITPILNPAH